MRRGVAEQTRLYAGRPHEIARSILAQSTLPPPTRRVLVALMGLPGSGKSHFGRLVAERLGAFVVASDELRRRLFVAPSYMPGETRMVFAVAHAMVREVLTADRAVVFDATNLRERDRRPLYALADETAARLVLVRVTAPEPEIYRRLAERRAGGDPRDASEADERVYRLMRERYEEPSRPYVVVDSATDLAAALAAVAGAAAE